MLDELLKYAGDVTSWRWRPLDLILTDDCKRWYEVDFMVVTQVGIELHDVKGRAKNGGPYCEEDAKLKMAIAADRFRMFGFYVVWPGEVSSNWEKKKL